MKNQRKFKTLFKRLISGVSAVALSVGLLGSIPASADDSTIGYKYTLFAYSSEEGAISSSAANFCVNGNIATNGTISAGQNFNVNGEKKEHANETMPDLSKAINEKFFAENVDVKAENYAKNETNIEVKVPTDVKGKAELNGNIKLAAGVKAMGDILLSGGVLNNDNTVLFSENGSININSENVSLTGLIYAPKGNIVIESKNLNLNSVVMIANKITLNAPNININSNAEMAKFVQEAIDKNNNNGSGGEEDPVTDPVIYAYGEYNVETKSVDIEWYSNVTGEFAVLESLNGTDYSVVSKVSNDTKCSIKVTSDFIKKYFKVATIKDGKTIESIPFSIVNANGKYTTELLDTDKDGLADLYEEMLGTDKTVPDTDKDGLTDYEEAYITSTDPTKYDSVTEGVSDADADNDKDGLTNKREIELKTDPNSDDTDSDTLKDGDEVSKYNTDPIKRDTDGDELEDDDELKFNFDPNKKDTDNNGIIDGKEKHQQSYDFVPDNKEQAVTKVSVSMSASGNIEKTTTVESIMNKDVLCSNVVGLVGEPFSIESESSFDKATITFTVDKTKLGETEFDNLMFLWYDRENDNFVELETSHNAVNSTVSIETTHFSDYMIVDSEKWWNNWREINNDIQKYSSGTPKTSSRAVSLVFQCTSNGDPDFINPDPDDTMMSHHTNYRTLISDYLIASMSESDVLSFVNMHQTGYASSNFSGDKDRLKDSIEPYINQIFKSTSYSYNAYRDSTLGLYVLSTEIKRECPDKETKSIVYITDHDVFIDDVALRNRYPNISPDIGKDYKSVPVYFVCVGEFSKTDLDKTNLKKIADETNGKVYTAATLNELYSELNPSLIFPEAKDSDKDRFSDDEETYGLIVDSSGTRYKTKPDEEDSDKDDLKDNEEVEVKRSLEKGKDKYGKEVYKWYHHMKSNPLEQDSDGDGINDKEDKYPRTPYKLPFIDTLKKMEKYVDEAKKNGVKALIHYSHKDDVPYYETKHYNESNAVITMNIIRSIKYNGLKWELTSGDSFDPIRDYINQKDPGIMKKFKEYKDGKGTFKDPNGNDVELLHMMATLSAYFDSNTVSGFFIDRELAGWAGDLQSMIYDVKIKAYGTDENLNEVALEKTGKNLTDIEKNLPSDQKKYVNTHFSMSDMLGDIDAENMYYLYHRNNELKLSEIFEDYYSKKKYYKTRFELFVNNYDGIENLEKATSRFTNEEGSILKPGTWITNEIRYSILRDKASEAADDKDVQKRYEKSVIISSLVDKQNGYLKHALPEPQIITKEESDALTYGFVTFIRIHWNIERFG